MTSAPARLFALLLIMSSMTFSSCGSKPATAVIETDLGTIKFELLWNDSPETAENFRQLAERGRELHQRHRVAVQVRQQAMDVHRLVY